MTQISADGKSRETESVEENTDADRESGDVHGVSHRWPVEPLRPGEVGTLSRVS